MCNKPEEDCEKFIQRAAELANINPNENDENSKFREDGGVQSTSGVVDIESIKAKVEVAIKCLAEGSSASSATQRAALIAFTNSEDSMRSTPAFLKGRNIQCFGNDLLKPAATLPSKVLSHFHIASSKY